MPTLTDEIKTFIVKGLACFDTPSEVAGAVKATFDVDVTRQQVHRYDPACVQPPARRWRALHAAARHAYLAQFAEIGVAHKAARLSALDRMVHQAAARNDFRLAASILEQAAKECGGMYDGRRRLPHLLASMPATRPPHPADGGECAAAPVESRSPESAAAPGPGSPDA
ncbi:MAG TPA: DUF2280 domain-containing protein [Dongiaceae bacterium]|jgi:hypothetical protein|nr:DUF2280 domain-containing protein [Dongiaceae bacterium]